MCDLGGPKQKLQQKNLNNLIKQFLEANFFRCQSVIYNKVYLVNVLEKDFTTICIELATFSHNNLVWLQKTLSLQE